MNHRYHFGLIKVDASAVVLVGMTHSVVLWGGSLKEENIIKPGAASGFKHIPGSSGLPLFGHTFQFISDPIKTTLKLYEKHGPVFRTNVFFLDVVNVIGPEAVKAVLADPDKNFSSKLAIEAFVKDFIGRAILARDFEDHRYHRRIMQSAFKSGPMKTYQIRMTPHIALGLSRCEKDRYFLFHPFIKRLSLRLASEIFLGLEEGGDLDTINAALVTMMNGAIAPIRLKIPGLAFNEGLVKRKVIADYISKLIVERRANPSMDMLSEFCNAKSEQGEQFSDSDIIDHMLFMWLAAHETTTSLLCHVMYRICQFPEWQNRLREECCGIGKAAIDYEDLPKLEQMDWVIKETLRMHPPAPLTMRTALRECEFYGYHIPANTMISIGPGVSHFLKEFWTEPEKFDPQRFSSERAEDKSHSHAYVPFGGGAHTCIGMHFASMEAKAILYQMLLNHSWQTPEGYDPKFTMMPIPKPKDNLPILMKDLPRRSRLH
ncbi:MAG: cytochrome P450 [Gammaproteobacteria bacterium]|nr:MAG: cytochrome P450 [Gammaproteobacteria bacterium]